MEQFYKTRLSPLLEDLIQDGYVSALYRSSQSTPEDFVSFLHNTIVESIKYLIDEYPLVSLYLIDLVEKELRKGDTADIPRSEAFCSSVIAALAGSGELFNFRFNFTTIRPLSMRVIRLITSGGAFYNADPNLYQDLDELEEIEEPLVGDFVKITGERVKFDEETLVTGCEGRIINYNRSNGVVVIMLNEPLINAMGELFSVAMVDKGFVSRLVTYR